MGYVCRTGLEAQHQRALMAWWSLNCKRYALPEMALYHPPNEGHRTVMTGAMLKRLGLRKGFPDVLLLARSPLYGMLFIEMKSEFGRPTKEQLEYLDFLRRQGYAACLCYGWDAARRCIEDYLNGRDIPEEM